MRKRLLRNQTLMLRTRTNQNKSLCTKLYRKINLSESECNIIHKTLSQNNSAHVPYNIITELKDDEHKEPSVTAKVTSYFNIFECGRNLLDQLEITYQRAFMASPVREGYYTPPARER